MADVIWEVEDIPDDSDVYMRAHDVYFRGKALQPGVFRVHEDGMSVDWDKYSTPEQTRQRTSQPLRNAVIRLPVVGIRDIGDLDVKHTPYPANRAHSDVVGIPNGGEDLTEVRASLLDISRVSIAL